MPLGKLKLFSQVTSTLHTKTNKQNIIIDQESYCSLELNMSLYFPNLHYNLFIIIIPLARGDLFFFVFFH